MIHKIHVLLKQYGERGIILTKRNLSLSMKIVLLLLSSAILAILCYAFFRNNVTDFYTFIETVEKPFNEKTFIKGFKEEAKNISIYSKDKNDKKELKNLLKKHDDYTNILLCNEKELSTKINVAQDELDQNKQNLEEEINKSNSPEYIEKVAREKLGMYLQNERVYVDSNK